MFAYVDNPDELNEQYDCAEWASGVADKIDDYDSNAPKKWA